MSASHQLPIVPIAATICHENGNCFPVKLHVVPSIGQLISLSSNINSRTGQEPTSFKLEVLQVVHDIQDVDEEASVNLNGSHAVRVYVRDSSDARLEICEKS